MIFNYKLIFTIVMEELKTLNFINEPVDKEVNIILKNGTIYRSKLKSFDIHTSVVM